MIYSVVHGLARFFFLVCFSKNRNHWADVEVSNSSAVAKKRKQKSSNSADKTDEQPQIALPVEGVDGVDNVPIEADPSLKHSESSDDSIEELGVLRAPSESTGELVEGASVERNNADYVPATSSLIAQDPESTVELNKEALGEPNFVPSSSPVTEFPDIEKTSLQRVGSDPTLSKDDQKREAADMESVGNFRRSCSLRERGTRKLQELNTKARSASDENLKELERKKKRILGMDEPTTSNLQDGKSTVEVLLPSDLHGVLESGFVKRYSRKFECDDIVPELESSVALVWKAETDVDCAPAEGDKITDEEQDEGITNEEPEPGVVKKHKEGYELKHRESLKRRVLLQRGSSDEKKSAKQEGDEVEGFLAVDVDTESVQTVAELEDELRGVNVVALVKKVNEDMKKEVTVRRMSASKKEQELRAYVEKAGEQMKKALIDNEDETLAKDKSTVADEANFEQITEEFFTGKIKRNARVFVLEEDAQESPSDNSQLRGTFENRQPAALKPSVAQNVSASVEFPEQQEESEKGTNNKEGSEGHRGVAQEEGLSLLKGQTRSADAYTEQENRTTSENESVGTKPTEKTPEKGRTSELLEDKKDEQSEQNSEDTPQKGLVKRHTLVIEGKLQPLDQELEKNVERPSGEERHGQKVSSSLSDGETNNAALQTERTEVNVVQDMDSKEKNSSEMPNTCELSEDSESTDSEHDTNVPPKGLVKRHTLLIEGKIQPLDQECEKNVEKDTGNETENTEDQDACASVKEDTRVVIESQQYGLNVVQGIRSGAEALETSASGAKEPHALSEDTEDRGSEQDTENDLHRGLVQRHKLLIEERLQPLDQELNKDFDDGKESELVLDMEAVLPVEDQGQLRYQIERTNDSEVEQYAEANQDNESVSGLVKREKLRIEERLQSTPVDPIQELEHVSAGGDNTALEDVDGEEVDTTKKGGKEIEQINGDEEEQNEAAVDTSSVVRVKEQAQHLEGIIRVKSQTSKDGDPNVSDQAPKFFIVPRAGSDEDITEGDEVEENSEGRMDVLSDSAVNIALLKAQENLDSEKENIELDNKSFLDWEVTNVKQRRQIFEDIVRDFDKDSRKGDEESDSKSNSLRRHESMPKMTRAAEKPALRRRSVSDVTTTGSDRKVGYTIVFRKKVDGSSSSSSLPRDWSPLEHRQRQEDIDDQRDTCQSVKETIQVLDSKNQRNISNIS